MESQRICKFCGQGEGDISHWDITSKKVIVHIFVCSNCRKKLLLGQMAICRCGVYHILMDMITSNMVVRTKTCPVCKKG